MTIKEKLLEQYQKDIKKMMESAEGRRVFSFLIMACGYNDANMVGNSRDFFNAGRRSVAIDLIGSMDALGLTGLDLRQKAEKEYIMLQSAIEVELREKEKKDNATQKRQFTKGYQSEHKGRDAPR